MNPALILRQNVSSSDYSTLIIIHISYLSHACYVSRVSFPYRITRKVMGARCLYRVRTSLQFRECDILSGTKGPTAIFLFHRKKLTESVQIWRGERVRDTNPMFGMTNSNGTNLPLFVFINSPKLSLNDHRKVRRFSEHSSDKTMENIIQEALTYLSLSLTSMG
jgi:hypothetical protein